MKRLLLILLLIESLTSSIQAQIPSTMPGSWQWVKTIGSSSQLPFSSGTDERINMMKTDIHGNTYVCGSTFDYPKVKGLNGHDADGTVFNNHQNQNILKGYIAKYDCNGSLLWFNQFGDSMYHSYLSDLVIDSAENVYVVGNCRYGNVPFYFNDSVILPIIGNFIRQNGLLIKINKAGKLVWHSSLASLSGYTSRKYFTMATGGIYKNTFPSLCIIKGDTISILAGIIDTITSTAYISHLGVLDFNKNDGSLIQDSKLFDNPTTSGTSISLKGFGQLSNGNFIAAINIGGINNIQILDSMVSVPGAIGRGVLIIFNRNHLIKKRLMADTIGIYESDFRDLSKGFIIRTEGKKGRKLIDNYICKNSTPPIYTDRSSPILYFKDIDSFKWALEPDTSNCNNNLSSPFISSNNVYSSFQPISFAQFGNQIFSFQANTTPAIFVKIDIDSGKINEVSPMIPTQSPAIQNNSIYNYNISVNEKGEIIACGNFFNNQIITKNDTGYWYGGNNDMFIIKFGLPCDTPAALIMPITCSNLVATANNSNGTIQISWQDISNIEYGYIVYRKNSMAGAYTVLASLAANTTSYTDASAAPNTVYWYEVAPYNNIDTAAACGSDSSKIINGLQPISNTNEYIQVWPNPCEQLLQLSFISPRQLLIEKLEVYDVIGRMQIQQLNKSITQSLQLDVSQLPSGVYFIKASTNAGTVQVGRFVKE